METYLGIKGLAGYVLLAEQTISRWVLNRKIPFHKIKKVIRFRLSEIEKRIDGGGMDGRVTPGPEGTGDGDLFAGVETGEAAEIGGADREAGENTGAGDATERVGTMIRAERESVKPKVCWISCA